MRRRSDIRHLRLHPAAGYTLLELAIVIIIIALVTASSLTVGKSVFESSSSVSTTNRLDIIEGALLAYRNAYNRLPCPGNAALAPGAAGYGNEAANLGSCTGGAPAANFSYTGLATFLANGSKMVEGSVPVRALSLPDEFMYDGWGNKIAYAVWAPITSGYAFLNYGITTNCGRIRVKNAAAVNRTDVGLYALFSYGADQHGAYNTAGARVSSASVNADTRINCHCDGAVADTGYLGTYVQKEPTVNVANPLDTFDDTFRFKERWQMQNLADRFNPGGHLICPYDLPGLRIDGEAANDRSATAIATGDVNGDGVPDMIIGAHDKGGLTGSVYVVYGSRTAFADPMALSTLDGTNGFRIDGIAASDYTGFSLATGDVNGDTIADIIIGAPQASPGAQAQAGSVFVVYGTDAPMAATLDLSTLNGTNGFRVNGTVAGEYVGYSVASADIRGNGISHLVIGAPGALANAGKVYVMFGSTAFALGTYTLDNNGATGVIDNAATKGFVLTGLAADETGVAVTTGDFNGDGIADIAAGASNYNTDGGLVYLVFGRSGNWSTPISLNLINGSNGARIENPTSNELAGSMLAAGDINGDGISDLMIGAVAADPGGNVNAGSTYVVFGHTTAWNRQFTLDNLNGVNGFRINGGAAGDESASSLAAGDFNGDNFSDIMIGAYSASPGGRAAAGATYVLFGKASGWASTFNLSAINGTNGIELDGAVAGDKVGFAVAAGDVNNDGKSDVLTGAGRAGNGGNSQSGSMYFYNGQRIIGAWTNPYDLSGL